MPVGSSGYSCVWDFGIRSKSQTSRGVGPSASTSNLVAEGDKVVVLTTRELRGEATAGANVLTFNDAGKLITFVADGTTAPPSPAQADNAPLVTAASDYA